MARSGEAVLLAGVDLLRVDEAQGVRSSVSSLTGWWETPDKRGDDTARVGSDGDFPAPRTFGPRMVTVAGDVSCPDRDSLFRVRDLLAGVLYSGSGTFEVQGHGPAQSAVVEQVGGLKWSERSPVAATWSLDLKAPDPRKYGVTRVFGPSSAGTSVQVFHSGNYPASPTIEVLTGSYMPGGFTAWGTGEDSFRVLEGVNSNEVLSADFETGLIRKNGAVIFGQTGYTELARVLPGRSRAANVTLADPVNGYGSYRVVVRDTFI